MNNLPLTNKHLFKIQSFDTVTIYSRDYTKTKCEVIWIFETHSTHATFTKEIIVEPINGETGNALLHNEGITIEYKYKKL